MAEQNEIQLMIDQVGMGLQEDAMEERALELGMIQSMSSNDLLQYVYDQIDILDVIIDGYGLASAITEAGGIALSGLLRGREALEGVVVWLEAQLEIPANASETETSTAAETPSTRKKKRPVVADDEDL